MAQSARPSTDSAVLLLDIIANTGSVADAAKDVMQSLSDAGGDIAVKVEFEPTFDASSTDAAVQRMSSTVGAAMKTPAESMNKNTLNSAIREARAEINSLVEQFQMLTRVRKEALEGRGGVGQGGANEIARAAEKLREVSSIVGAKEGGVQSFLERNFTPTGGVKRGATEVDRATGRATGTADAQIAASWNRLLDTFGGDFKVAISRLRGTTETVVQQVVAEAKSIAGRYRGQMPGLSGEEQGKIATVDPGRVAKSTKDLVKFVDSFTRAADILQGVSLDRLANDIAVLVTRQQQNLEASAARGNVGLAGGRGRSNARAAEEAASEAGKALEAVGGGRDATRQASEQRTRQLEQELQRSNERQRQLERELAEARSAQQAAQQEAQKPAQQEAQPAAQQNTQVQQQAQQRLEAAQQRTQQLESQLLASNREKAALQAQLAEAQQRVRVQATPPATSGRGAPQTETGGGGGVAAPPRRRPPSGTGPTDAGGPQEPAEQPEGFIPRIKRAIFGQGRVQPPPPGWDKAVESIVVAFNHVKEAAESASTAMDNLRRRVEGGATPAGGGTPLAGGPRPGGTRPFHGTPPLHIQPAGTYAQMIGRTMDVVSGEEAPPLEAPPVRVPGTRSGIGVLTSATTSQRAWNAGLTSLYQAAMIAKAQQTAGTAGAASGKGPVRFENGVLTGFDVDEQNTPSGLGIGEARIMGELLHQVRSGGIQSGQNVNIADALKNNPRLKGILTRLTGEGFVRYDAGNNRIGINAADIERYFTSRLAPVQKHAPELAGFLDRSPIDIAKETIGAHLMKQLEPLIRPDAEVYRRDAQGNVEEKAAGLITEGDLVGIAQEISREMAVTTRAGKGRARTTMLDRGNVQDIVGRHVAGRTSDRVVKDLTFFGHQFGATSRTPVGQTAVGLVGGNLTELNDRNVATLDTQISRLDKKIKEVTSEIASEAQLAGDSRTWGQEAQARVEKSNRKIGTLVRKIAEDEQRLGEAQQSRREAKKAADDYTREYLDKRNDPNATPEDVRKAKDMARSSARALRSTGRDVSFSRHLLDRRRGQMTRRVGQFQGYYDIANEHASPEDIAETQRMISDENAEKLDRLMAERSEKVALRDRITKNRMAKNDPNRNLGLFYPGMENVDTTGTYGANVRITNPLLINAPSEQQPGQVLRAYHNMGKEPGSDAPDRLGIAVTSGANPLDKELGWALNDPALLMGAKAPGATKRRFRRPQNAVETASVRAWNTLVGQGLARIDYVSEEAMEAYQAEMAKADPDVAAAEAILQASRADFEKKKKQYEPYLRAKTELSVQEQEKERVGQEIDALEKEMGPVAEKLAKAKDLGLTKRQTDRLKARVQRLDDRRTKLYEGYRAANISIRDRRATIARFESTPGFQRYRPVATMVDTGAGGHPLDPFYERVRENLIAMRHDVVAINNSDTFRNIMQSGGRPGEAFEETDEATGAISHGRRVLEGEEAQAVLNQMRADQVPTPMMVLDPAKSMVPQGQLPVGEPGYDDRRKGPRVVAREIGGPVDVINNPELLTAKMADLPELLRNNMYLRASREVYERMQQRAKAGETTYNKFYETETDKAGKETITGLTQDARRMIGEVLGPEMMRPDSRMPAADRGTYVTDEYTTTDQGRLNGARVKKAVGNAITKGLGWVRSRMDEFMHPRADQSQGTYNAWMPVTVEDAIAQGHKEAAGLPSDTYAGKPVANYIADPKMWAALGLAEPVKRMPAIPDWHNWEFDIPRPEEGPPENYKETARDRGLPGLARPKQGLGRLGTTEETTLRSVEALLAAVNASGQLNAHDRQQFRMRQGFRAAETFRADLEVRQQNGEEIDAEDLAMLRAVVGEPGKDGIAQRAIAGRYLNDAERLTWKRYLGSVPKRMGELTEFKQDDLSLTALNEVLASKPVGTLGIAMPRAFNKGANGQVTSQFRPIRQSVIADMLVDMGYSPGNGLGVLTDDPAANAERQKQFEEYMQARAAGVSDVTQFASQSKDPEMVAKARHEAERLDLARRRQKGTRYDLARMAEAGAIDDKYWEEPRHVQHPEDADLRATARRIAAEMNAGAYQHDLGTNLQTSVGAVRGSSEEDIYQELLASQRKASDQKDLYAQPLLDKQGQPTYNKWTGRQIFLDTKGRYRMNKLSKREQEPDWNPGAPLAGEPNITAQQRVGLLWGATGEHQQEALAAAPSPTVKSIVQNVIDTVNTEGYGSEAAKKAYADAQKQLLGHLKESLGVPEGQALSEHGYAMTGFGVQKTTPGKNAEEGAHKETIENPYASVLGHLRSMVAFGGEATAQARREQTRSRALGTLMGSGAEGSWDKLPAAERALRAGEAAAAEKSEELKKAYLDLAKEYQAEARTIANKARTEARKADRHRRDGIEAGKNQFYGDATFNDTIGLGPQASREAEERAYEMRDVARRAEYGDLPYMGLPRGEAGKEMLRSRSVEERMATMAELAPLLARLNKAGGAADAEATAASKALRAETDFALYGKHQGEEKPEKRLAKAPVIGLKDARMAQFSGMQRFRGGYIIQPGSAATRRNVIDPDTGEATGETYDDMLPAGYKNLFTRRAQGTSPGQEVGVVPVQDGANTMYVPVHRQGTPGPDVKTKNWNVFGGMYATEDEAIAAAGTTYGMQLRPGTEDRILPHAYSGVGKPQDLDPRTKAAIEKGRARSAELDPMRQDVREARERDVTFGPRLRFVRKLIDNIDESLKEPKGEKDPGQVRLSGRSREQVLQDVEKASVELAQTATRLREAARKGVTESFDKERTEIDVQLRKGDINDAQANAAISELNKKKGDEYKEIRTDTWLRKHGGDRVRELMGVISKGNLEIGAIDSGTGLPPVLKGQRGRAAQQQRILDTITAATQAAAAAQAGTAPPTKRPYVKPDIVTASLDPAVAAQVNESQAAAATQAGKTAKELNDEAKAAEAVVTGLKHKGEAIAPVLGQQKQLEDSARNAATALKEEASALRTIALAMKSINRSAEGFIADQAAIRKAAGGIVAEQERTRKGIEGEDTQQKQPDAMKLRLEAEEAIRTQGLQKTSEEWRGRLGGTRTQYGPDGKAITGVDKTVVNPKDGLQHRTSFRQPNLARIGDDLIERLAQGGLIPNDELAALSEANLPALLRRITGARAKIARVEGNEALTPEQKASRLYGINQGRTADVEQLLNLIDKTPFGARLRSLATATDEAGTTLPGNAQAIKFLGAVDYFRGQSGDYGDQAAKQLAVLQEARTSGKLTRKQERDLAAAQKRATDEKVKGLFSLGTFVESYNAAHPDAQQALPGADTVEALAKARRAAVKDMTQRDREVTAGLSTGNRAFDPAARKLTGIAADVGFLGGADQMKLRHDFILGQIDEMEKSGELTPAAAEELRGRAGKERLAITGMAGTGRGSVAEDLQRARSRQQRYNVTGTKGPAYDDLREIAVTINRGIAPGEGRRLSTNGPRRAEDIWQMIQRNNDRYGAYEDKFDAGRMTANGARTEADRLKAFGIELGGSERIWETRGTMLEESLKEREKAGTVTKEEADALRQKQAEGAAYLARAREQNMLRQKQIADRLTEAETQKAEAGTKKGTARRGGAYDLEIAPKGAKGEYSFKTVGEGIRRVDDAQTAIRAAELERQQVAFDLKNAPQGTDVSAIMERERKAVTKIAEARRKIVTTLEQLDKVWLHHSGEIEAAAREGNTGAQTMYDTVKRLVSAQPDGSTELQRQTVLAKAAEEERIRVEVGTGRTGPMRSQEDLDEVLMSGNLGFIGQLGARLGRLTTRRGRNRFVSRGDGSLTKAITGGGQFQQEIVFDDLNNAATAAARVNAENGTNFALPNRSFQALAAQNRIQAGGIERQFMAKGANVTKHWIDSQLEKLRVSVIGIQEQMTVIAGTIDLIDKALVKATGAARTHLERQRESLLQNADALESAAQQVQKTQEMLSGARANAKEAVGLPQGFLDIVQHKMRTYFQYFIASQLTWRAMQEVQQAFVGALEEDKQLKVYQTYAGDKGGIPNFGKEERRLTEERSVDIATAWGFKVQDMTRLQNIWYKATDPMKNVKERMDVAFGLAEATAEFMRATGTESLKAQDSLEGILRAMQLPLKEITRVSDVIVLAGKRTGRQTGFPGRRYSGEGMDFGETTSYSASLVEGLNQIARHSYMKGMDLELATALLARMSDASQKAPSQIGTAMARTFSSLDKTRARKILGGLGIELETPAGEERPFEKWFTELLNTPGIRDGNKLTPKGQSILASLTPATQGFPVLDTMAEQWESAQRQARELRSGKTAGETGRTAMDIAQTADVQIKRLTASINGLVLLASDRMIPNLIAMTKGFSNLFSATSKNADAIGGLITLFAKWAGSAILLKLYHNAMDLLRRQAEAVTASMLRMQVANVDAALASDRITGATERETQELRENAMAWRNRAAAAIESKEAAQIAAARNELKDPKNAGWAPGLAANGMAFFSAITKTVGPMLLIYELMDGMGALAAVVGNNLGEGISRSHELFNKFLDDMNKRGLAGDKGAGGKGTRPEDYQINGLEWFKLGAHIEEYSRTLLPLPAKGYLTVGQVRELARTRPEYRELADRVITESEDIRWSGDAASAPVVTPASDDTLTRLKSITTNGQTTGMREITPFEAWSDYMKNVVQTQFQSGVVPETSRNAFNRWIEHYGDVSREMWTRAEGNKDFISTDEGQQLVSQQKVARAAMDKILDEAAKNGMSDEAVNAAREQLKKADYIATASMSEGADVYNAQTIMEAAQRATEDFTQQLSVLEHSLKRLAMAAEMVSNSTRTAEAGVKLFDARFKGTHWTFDQADERMKLLMGLRDRYTAEARFQQEKAIPSASRFYEQVMAIPVKGMVAKYWQDMIKSGELTRGSIDAGKSREAAVDASTAARETEDYDRSVRLLQRVKAGQPATETPEQARANTAATKRYNERLKATEEKFRTDMQGEYANYRALTVLGRKTQRPKWLTPEMEQTAITSGYLADSAVGPLAHQRAVQSLSGAQIRESQRSIREYNQEVLKSLSPNVRGMARHWPMILELSKRHGVNPIVIGSIMATESSGDVDAQGTLVTRGAYRGQRAAGLMQVMPGNLANMGIPQSMWFDRRTNIEAGIRIYKENLRKFRGDENMAIMAYLGLGARDDNGTTPAEYVRDVTKLKAQVAKLQGVDPRYVQEASKLIGQPVGTALEAVGKSQLRLEGTQLDTAMGALQRLHTSKLKYYDDLAKKEEIAYQIAEDFQRRGTAMWEHEILILQRRLELQTAVTDQLQRQVRLIDQQDRLYGPTNRSVDERMAALKQEREAIRVSIRAFSAQIEEMRPAFEAIVTMREGMTPNRRLSNASNEEIRDFLYGTPERKAATETLQREGKIPVKGDLAKYINGAKIKDLDGEFVSFGTFLDRVLMLLDKQIFPQVTQLRKTLASLKDKDIQVQASLDQEPVLRLEAQFQRERLALQHAQEVGRIARERRRATVSSYGYRYEGSGYQTGDLLADIAAQRQLAELRWRERDQANKMAAQYTGPDDVKRLDLEARARQAEVDARNAERQIETLRQQIIETPSDEFGELRREVVARMAELDKEVARSGSNARMRILEAEQNTARQQADALRGIIEEKTRLAAAAAQELTNKDPAISGRAQEAVRRYREQIDMLKDAYLTLNKAAAEHARALESFKQYRDLQANWARGVTRAVVMNPGSPGRAIGDAGRQFSSGIIDMVIGRYVDKAMSNLSSGFIGKLLGIEKKPQNPELVANTQATLDSTVAIEDLVHTAQSGQLVSPVVQGISNLTAVVENILAAITGQTPTAAGPVKVGGIAGAIQKAGGAPLPVTVAALRSEAGLGSPRTAGDILKDLGIPAGATVSLLPQHYHEIARKYGYQMAADVASKTGDKQRETYYRKMVAQGPTSLAGLGGTGGGYTLSPFAYPFPGGEKRMGGSSNGVLLPAIGAGIGLRYGLPTLPRASGMGLANPTLGLGTPDIESRMAYLRKELQKPSASLMNPETQKALMEYDTLRDLKAGMHKSYTLGQLQAKGYDDKTIASRYRKVTSPTGEVTYKPRQFYRLSRGETAMAGIQSAGALASTYQMAKNPDVPAFEAMLGGVTQGFGAGSMFGPMGGYIGAAVGGIMALVGLGKRHNKTQEKIFDQMPKRSDLMWNTPGFMPFSAFVSGRGNITVNVNGANGMAADLVRQAAVEGVTVALRQQYNRGLIGVA